MNVTKQLELALRNLLNANAEVSNTHGDREQHNIAIARQEVAEREAHRLLSSIKKEA